MYILTLNQGKQVLVRESKFVRKAVIEYIEKLENIYIAIKDTSEMACFLYTKLKKGGKKMLDIIKQGEINEINVKAGRARVIFPDRDNKISDWLNILVPFSESHQDNYNLKLGQTVVVLSIPDMMEQGYILGCPMRSCNIEKDEVRRTFSDGGMYKYHNGVLTLAPISKIVIDADVEIKKNLLVEGNTITKGTTTTSGTLSMDKHTHTGVTPGNDRTGGPI